MPLMAEISPLMQYMNLFSGFVPGGTGARRRGRRRAAGGGGGGGGTSQPVADAMLKKLVGQAERPRLRASKS